MRYIMIIAACTVGTIFALFIVVLNETEQPVECPEIYIEASIEHQWHMPPFHDALRINVYEGNELLETWYYYPLPFNIDSLWWTYKTAMWKAFAIKQTAEVAAAKECQQ